MGSHWRARLLALGLTAAAAALLGGCNDEYSAIAPNGRSQAPIPDKTLAKIAELGATQNSPILIRAYKKESELEIWKQTSNGQYALLKTFPMCRWSGQLGPKTREGDRQVPEGFYTITPGQMNPNSNYYLSFNVGYPNAYDRAYGRDGGTIMVHGVCSSAGCFSMTDGQIAEIYALAREAFRGGQREIQMQSYPFHMTAENLAKHRLDPNIGFWKELKNGSDHFEVTLSEPSVLVCGKHYQFGATAKGDLSPTAACPALKRDADVEALVAEKQQKDETEVASLIAKGVKPIQLVYEDGGQNAYFRGHIEGSRPEALAAAPEEIPLDDRGRPISAVVQVAAAQPTHTAVQAADASPHAAAPAFGLIGGGSSGGDNVMTSLISKVTGAPAQSSISVYEPAEPIPSDVPLPPRRSAMRDSQMKLAKANDTPAAQ